MLKRLSVALAALFVLSSSAFGAGTIPYSLSQQLDEYGKPLSGCKLYIIQAGTTSAPQNPYSDSALTIPLANPLICDAAGRLPQFFVADGSIKVRLTKSTGVNVVTADGILVVGASSGGGGGSPVDATTVLATGDVKPRYGTGILSGFVRANGRTIGSATSGATERANADCQTLFEYLWGADANLTVSTGRGVSANADWVANKTIALPTARGRALTGLADMGNTASTVLDGVTFQGGLTSTTLGATGGASTRTLLTANLPAYTPTGTLSLSTTVGTTGTFSGTASVTSTNWVASNSNDSTAQNVGGSGSGLTVVSTSGSVSKIASTGSASGSISATSTATPTGSFTGAAQGGSSTAFESVSPIWLITIYIKL